MTRSRTMATGVCTTVTVTHVAIELARVALAAHPGERDITLLAVSLSNLIDEHALQLELPLGLGDELHRPGTAIGLARWGVDTSVDAICDRFGADAVGYGMVVFSDDERVPEAFRELAERDHRRVVRETPPTRRPGP